MGALIADVDHVLTTTRAVRRRLDFDRPVPRDVIDECFLLALQAPTGGNAEDWRFVAVGDPESRRKLGDIYRRCFATHVAAPLRETGATGDVARGRLGAMDERTNRILRDAHYLAENFDRAPWMIFAYATRPNPEAGAAHGTTSAVYGSVYPAVWSFNLALRSRGLGTVITTLHLHAVAEVAAIIGAPATATLCCVLPVAYTKGIDFHPARRRPLGDVVYYEEWSDG